MNLKRRLLPLLYITLMLGICYSGLQLGEDSVRAEEAATCCVYSSGCPGTQVCYLPGERAACCDPAAPSCTGANYCEAQRPPQND